MTRIPCLVRLATEMAFVAALLSVVAQTATSVSVDIATITALT